MDTNFSPSKYTLTLSRQASATERSRLRSGINVQTTVNWSPSSHMPGTELIGGACRGRRRQRRDRVCVSRQRGSERAPAGTEPGWSRPAGPLSSLWGSLVDHLRLFYRFTLAETRASRLEQRPTRSRVAVDCKRAQLRRGVGVWVECTSTQQPVHPDSNSPSWSGDHRCT